MELAIHTYGHIDAMFHVLSGIAMLMNNKFMDSLIVTMSLFATSYYGAQMAYNGGNGQYKQYIVKVLGMIIIINAALLPKTEMWVYDHVSKKRDKVDNLPYGFAVPVGMLEAFGDIITGGFEQAFRSINSDSQSSANYRDYGMVFGARLVNEARNWRIKTPEFAENMHNFMRRCVMRDAMIGISYTVQDLLTSRDIWTLVSENANNIRKVVMRVGNDWELVSCRDAAKKIIEPNFKAEFLNLEKLYSNTEFASANSSDHYRTRSTESSAINKFFKANIQLAFSSNFGASHSAEDLVRQQLMMHSLSSLADRYGYTRASQTQESSWMISGDLASLYLPLLLTVMKGLIYSSFIFMVPMMLISGGGRRYLSYIVVVTSLQLWPALNVILNLFIDLFSSSTLSNIANGIISFATFSRVGNYADKIVAVASGLQMTVPFLSFAIVQGGVGGFIQLASNITGASQQAAASAASEVVTGNRSFDNVSTGNMQLAMQSGFKTDWNSSYAAGANSFQHMDGTMEKVLGSGETLYLSGTGMTMSGGSNKFTQRDSTSSQIAHNLSNAQSLLDSDQRSYSVAERETFGKTANFVKNLAMRESSGETIDYSKAGEEGNSMQKVVNNAINLRESYGYSWDQAASTALRASANASTPLSSVTGVGASVNAEAGLSASNSSNQTYGSDNQINREQSVRSDYSSVVRAASNQQFASSNNIDTGYSDDIRGSYERQKSLESSIAKRSEQVQTYSHQLAHVQSKDASWDQDMYHKLEQNVASSYGISAKDAHDWIERNDPRVASVRQGMVQNAIHHIEGDINAGKIATSQSRANQSLNNFSNEYENRIDRDHTKNVKSYAVSNGLNPEDNEFVRDNVSHKANELLFNNQNKINQQKAINESAVNNMTDQVTKLEEDRIGQGTTSKGLGYIVNSDTGTTIGGPTNPVATEKKAKQSKARNDAKGILEKVD